MIRQREEDGVREHCTCHDISEARFRAACAAGADSVKACFKHIGCMPKCANCVPMIRKVLREHEA
jgi:bacterioferritin-associated ferredoxin